MTKNDADSCFRIWTPSNGCTFALGQWVDTDYIAAWWRDRPPNAGGTKPKPTETQCINVEQYIPLCGSPPEDPDPPCPSPPVSGDCDWPCDDGGTGNRAGGADWSSTWDEQCQAYALMPAGWVKDPWTAATAFFTVGKIFPSQALEEPEYTAERALAENRLGPTVLGVVGTTPLWGGEEGRIQPGWRKLVRQVGVCVTDNALLASPHWTEPSSILRFPALMRCDGADFAKDKFEMYLHGADWPEEKWAESGALAADVLPLLERVRGHDLVCITPELADERRQARGEQ